VQKRKRINKQKITPKKRTTTEHNKEMMPGEEGEKGEGAGMP
jgi:hypothetical protein